MLFAGSDSEGDICGLEMNDRPSNWSVQSLPRIAIVFTKHKQVIISALYPTGMGGGAGVDVVLVSIGEADDRTRLRRLFWSHGFKVLINNLLLSSILLLFPLFLIICNEDKNTTR